MLGNPTFVHACWLAMILLAMNSSNTTLQTQDQKISNNDNKAVEKPLTSQANNNAKQSLDMNNHDAQIQRDSRPFQLNNQTTQSTAPIYKLKELDKLKFHKLVENSKLYYIGVYESSAQEYTDEEQRNRKAECESSHQSSPLDCWDYAYRAIKNVPKTVTIHINSQNNISLILSSYDSVKWIITGNTQRVNFIYLTGYHSSDVSIPAISSKNIYASFYDDSTCSSCSISNLNYFYGYKQDAKVYNITQDYFGKPLDLFQGQYKATKFSIN
jgi:hypothetical protein